MSTEAIARVIGLVDKAEKMTREVRKQDWRTHLFDFAEEQLQFMRKILEEGRVPTFEEKHKIGVGRMAIQEFEGGRLDDYADALECAAGAFRSLGGSD